MFRIEFLKLTSHPQLGNIKLNLSDNSEYQKSEFPYTSVIIGSNGTGKSFILRTIAEIFRQFHAYSTSESEKKIFNLPYSFHLRYRFYHNTYEIATRRLEVLTGSRRKEYIFFKNRPLDISFSTKDLFEKETGFEVLPNELEFPTKVLVNSIMNNDRFVFKKTQPNDFYQYLGARSTSSTASTKSSVRKTIRHVFNATSTDDNFVSNLKDLLDFLEFQQSFKVVYKTKINKLFFSQQLTKSNFKKYFEHWWDEDFKFSKRQKENPLWSIPYYNNNVRDNDELTEKLIQFLNDLPNDENIFKHKPRSTSKIIELDLFNSGILKSDLILISHLENLDIINLEGIQIKKSSKSLNIDEISSGEYHLLITLIGIFANVADNSLILIDEPEISLHPNWQMRYISFLKNVFRKYANCHFILTTHSHFLVSDMEGSTSFLTGLKRVDSELETIDIDTNTYGWSAEDVLYNIFDVTSTRNFYVAEEVGKILNEISKQEINKNRIKNKLNDLSKIKKSLKQNDPLLSLIVKIENEFANA